MSNATNHKSATFSIVGPDVDLDMLRVLTPGDSVLAEINGSYLYATPPNPKIATRYPWTVEYNEPGDHLIISNQFPTDQDRTYLQLNYSDLITSSEHQPALFHITSGSLVSPTVPEVWIVLQLVSCKTVTSGVCQFQAPFAEDDFREYLDDDRVKIGVLEAFITQIQRLSRSGWRIQSSNRFRLRANVSQALFDGFRNGDFEVLFKATDDQLVRIAEEFHAMTAMHQLGSMIQHDPLQIANVAPYKKGVVRHDAATVENNDGVC